MDTERFLVILAFVFLLNMFIFESDNLFATNDIRNSGLIELYENEPTYSPLANQYLGGARGDDITCSDGSTASVACVYPSKPYCLCNEDAAECGCI